jgi:hypothetical protein
MSLSFPEIGDTTPIEFEALVSQYLKQQDMENMRFGQVCATLANLQRDADKTPEPYRSTDFFSPLSTQQEPIEDESNEQAAAVILDNFWVAIKSRTKVN